MAYVRRKTIKGNTYQYLVKSVRDGKRVRQVFVAYIGNPPPASGGARHEDETTLAGQSISPWPDFTPLRGPDVKTRYVMLLHLPHGRTAEHVRDALTTTITTLPQHLRASLTWDQGTEMARHHEFTIATGVPVYFCDPHSPWQRGSNENTNGLLRQYFPKGTDLTIHTAEHLTATAAKLNRRPRKTLDWDTPAERLTTLLTQTR